MASDGDETAGRLVELAVRASEAAAEAELAAARQAAARVAERLGLVVHGGTAIARVLAAARGPDATVSGGAAPDVDVFCSKGKNARNTAHDVARRISNELGKAELGKAEPGKAEPGKAEPGKAELRVIPAIHKTTFSVRMGRDVLADVSWIDPECLARLRTAAKEEGLPRDLAPASYLKMSIHYELGRPDVFTGRWRKLWPRLKALYEAFPKVSKGLGGLGSCCTAGGDGHDDAILRSLDAGFAVVGKHAFRRMTGCGLLDDWPVDLVYSGDDAISAVAILAHAADADYPPTRARETVLCPKYYRLAKDGALLARVFVSDTRVCTAPSGGLVYGSSDVVLHLLYSQFLKAQRPDDSRRRLAAAIDVLVGTQKMLPCDSGVHRRFS